MYHHRIRQFAHAARLLGAQQMALARMPAHNLSSSGDLEALGCATMCLQLLFLVLLHNFLFNLIWQRCKYRCGTRPARLPQGVQPGPRTSRLFSAPVAPAEYSLPFEDRIPLARGPRYLSSSGPSLRALHPGAPFPGHDERSWLSLCNLRPGTV